MKMSIASLTMIALLTSAQSVAYSRDVIPDTAELKKQITVMSKNSDNEISETIRDYVYAISKEHSTTDSKLRSLIDLNELLKNPPASPLALSDLMPVLQDFHVRSAADVLLLQRLLTGVGGSCKNSQAETLYRIGLEVAHFPVATAADNLVKIEAVCRVANELHDNREFAKRFALTTVELLADSPTFQIPSEKTNTELFLCLATSIVDIPPKTADGDLFVKTLDCALRIAEQRRDLQLESIESYFPELVRRSDPDTAARLQQRLVDTAASRNTAPLVLINLRTQLGYAYLLVGKNAQAESVLYQSAKDINSMSFAAQTLLVECLRREGKFDESDSLAEHMKSSNGWSTDEYAYVFSACAQVIRAQNAISRGDFKLALKLLQENEPTLSRISPFADFLDLKFPLSKKIFPTMATVLSNEVAVMTKLGQPKEAEQRQSELDKLNSIQARDAAEYERSQLINLPRLDFSEEQSVINATRYLELCSALKDDIRIEKILAYEEEYRTNNALGMAEFCLNACSKIGNGADEMRAVKNERIAIAELRGDLKTAKRLLEEQHKSEASNPDDLDRDSELAAALSLMMGEYDKCEIQSRILETHLFAKSSAANEDGRSAKEEYAWKYATGLLDRAHALAHQQLYKQALELLRNLITEPVGTEVSNDAYALMARCYEETKHPGLAIVAEQHAVDAIQGAGDKPRQPRLVADAKFQLGQFALEQGHLLRAQRYFSEALEIAQKSTLQETDLYKEIVLAVNRNQITPNSGGAKTAPRAQPK